MSAENPSILSHVSIGTNQFEKAVSFYDKVMEALGCKRVLEHPGAIGYGKIFPEFWVQSPYDQNNASAGNGYHVSFLAQSREEVDRFYQAAMENGAKDDGGPGPRPMYGEQYYGCFVRDLDGHKIEAMYWAAS